MDLTTAVWKSITCKPSQYSFASHTAIAYNGLIHIHGGTGTSPSLMLDINPESGETIVSAARPSKRYTHSVCVVGTHAYYFGGKNFAYHVNELLDFNFEDATCQELKPANAPTPRSCHTCVAYNFCIYIFGGYSPGSPIFQDLYEYNTISKEWTNVQYNNNTDDTENMPKPVYSHTACVIGENMYIFGGIVTEQLQQIDEKGVVDGLYRFNFPSKTWTKLRPFGDRPCARFMHSAVVHNGNMIVFGGQAMIRMNDTWEYNPRLNRWRQLTTAGVIPSPRSGHIAVIIGNQMYVHGGKAQLQHCSGDLYILDLSRATIGVPVTIERCFGQLPIQTIILPGEKPPDSIMTMSLRRIQLDYGSQRELIQTQVKVIEESPIIGENDGHWRQTDEDGKDPPNTKSTVSSNPDKEILRRYQQPPIQTYPPFPSLNIPLLDHPHTEPPFPIRSSARSPPPSHSPASFSHVTRSRPKHSVFAKESLIPPYLRESGLSVLGFNILSLLSDMDTSDSFIQIDRHVYFLHRQFIAQRFPELLPFCATREPLAPFNTLRRQYTLLLSKQVPIQSREMKELFKKIRQLVKDREDNAKATCKSLNMSRDAALLFLGFIYSDSLLPPFFIPRLRSERHFAKLVKDGLPESDETWEEQVSTVIRERKDEPQMFGPEVYVEVYVKATEYKNARLKTLCLDQLYSMVSLDNVDLIVDAFKNQPQSQMTTMFIKWKEQMMKAAP
ncbi:putative Kelch-type beta propeller [Blattamonas nauphoetae]|uniref:Kelch-type beta propeller n=1 Tax=Blattamonas nauphoetae TaxID=2049346 RepID=A0ABQ9XPA1_9EUKA|nr:putative Kelch-type beta propeller [Blattamonas nauphoetae]